MDQSGIAFDLSYKTHVWRTDFRTQTHNTSKHEFYRDGFSTLTGDVHMFMTVIYAGDMTLNLREKKHKNFQNKAVYKSDFEISFSLNVSEKKLYLFLTSLSTVKKK